MLNIATKGCAAVEVVIGEVRLDQSRLNVETRSRTSRLPWRGQFSPELIEYLIDVLCPDSTSFLDPFCGSGTVLYEAAQRGHVAYGYEVNPAAWHLASMSAFGALTQAEKAAAIDEIRGILGAFGSPKADLFPTGRPALDFLTEVENATHSDIVVLALALSVLLGMGDAKEFSAAHITRGAISVINLLRELSSHNAGGRCFLTDARMPRVREESIEAVITSPPYINVFNYHQNFRPAVELLGWRPLEAAKSEIGANRKHRQNRFLTVIQYCLDMAQCIETTARSMKYGAPLVIILGRTSNVLGAAFQNGRILKSLIEASGAFGAVQVAERVFTNRFGSRIFEDILYTFRSGAPQVDDTATRDIAKKALQRALSEVPDKNREALLEALDSVQDVRSSERLRIAVPRAFSASV